MNNENVENKNNKHFKKHNKNKELELLQEEKSLLNEKLLRVSAEMQNMKRRYEDERSKIYKYDGEELIKKLLGTLDNFERAISMDDQNLDDEVSKFLSGFKLIYSKLRGDLTDLGVQEIECLGKEFNPENMEAVMTEHVEGKEKNIVIDVMQKGYIYKDKVIRPAMVKVSE